MIRLVSIFRNIEDMESVLRIYVEKIFPILHKSPGVIGTDVHSVSEVSQDIIQELENVQIIFETYFETYEDFTNLLLSPTGEEIMKQMEQNDIGDYYIYWTKVKRFEGENHVIKNPDISSTLNTADVIRALEYAEKTANIDLDGAERRGALKILKELRTNINFLEAERTSPSN
jgi:hypothetical protein